MTDLITRARKEWCEPPVSETTITHYGTKIITTPTGSLCPPSVVAALLDVLKDAYQGVDPFDGKATSGHSAVAIITRALEGK